MNFRHKMFMDKWLSGELKVITKNISGHIKRFLLEKYGEKMLIMWVE